MQNVRNALALQEPFRVRPHLVGEWLLPRRKLLPSSWRRNQPRILQVCKRGESPRLVPVVGPLDPGAAEQCGPPGLSPVPGLPLPFANQLKRFQLRTCPWCKEMPSVAPEEQEVTQLPNERLTDGIVGRPLGPFVEGHALLGDRGLPLMQDAGLVVTEA